MRRTKLRPLRRPSPFEARLARLLATGQLPPTMRQATLEFQQALVRNALARNSVRGHANLSATANDLGIPRATLYRVLKRL